MSTTTSTCFLMHCDAKIADDCDENVIDEEYETAIHFRTPTEAEEFAVQSRYWVKLGDVWHCVPCKRIVAEQPHDFIPDGPASSMCALCEDWATEGPHGLEVVPGQIELSGQGGETAVTHG